MKLINKEIEKDGGGVVTLIPEEPEDMWHAYNLIAVGDNLRASTIRKITIESATGSVGSNRIRTMLTISVEAVDFDTQACVLRVKGRNIVENQYVKMGAYHTLDLELNRKFSLAKANWDSVQLERINQACDPTQHADVAAVLMHEGLANICLVTPSLTLCRAKVDVNIPRKRKGQVAQREKGLIKFYEAVYKAILRHINFEIVKCVLVASPGFLKEDFFKYMCETAIKQDDKIILDNKAKFVLVHSSNGFKSSLRELLSDPVVSSKLSDTKAAGEVKALDNFYNILQSESTRAYYGYNHVARANEAQAIDTLMISDKLFRNQDVALRKQYVDLVDSVKESGGDVKIFSSMHVSGEQLDKLTGVAAILRFPMPEIEEEDEQDLSSDEEEKED